MTLPVPAQRTWSPSDLVTAAMMNANVRDAVNFLADVPVFVGYQTATQSIITATYTAIALDTTAVDTYSGHSNTTNNSRYVAQVTGWYFGVASWGCTVPATARVGGLWSSSGSTPNGAAVFTSGSSNGLTCVTAWILAYLSAGQYIAPSVYQNSGSSTTVGNVLAAVWWAHS